MAEKAKAYWQKALTFFKKIPKKIIAAVAVLLVVALAIVIWLNNRPYEILFTDLNGGEVKSILSYLDENGVTDYKVQGSDTILVPSDQEANLKMQLLMEGYPQSGFAYTYSSSGGPFSTEAERNTAELRDLQDRLSAVVMCFDGVKDAVVTITPGDDLRYILDSSRAVNATASVLLTMKDGRKLEEDYAEAIRNLIAHSVKGLNIDSVSITDSSGNTYGMGSAVSDADASALKLQLEEEWEHKIRSNVLQVLIPYYGEDNVKVGVNCTVDVSQVEENSTDVFLPEWAADGSTNGRGIVGSRIYDYVLVQDGDETTGGTVGTTTNADLPEYVEDLPELDGDEEEIHLGGQVDYENSNSKKHIIRTAGYLSDCMISVSINSTSAGEVDRSEIEKHVARAAGIKGTVDKITGKEILSDKISVVAKPFYEENSGVAPLLPDHPVKMWMVYAAAGGLLVIILLTVIIVSAVKKKKAKQLKKKMREMERSSGEAMNAAAAAEETPAVLQQTADVMNLKTEKSIELRQGIREFADENPEIAAQMLRTWLRGEEDNG